MSRKTKEERKQAHQDWERRQAIQRQGIVSQKPIVRLPTSAEQYGVGSVFTVNYRDVQVPSNGKVIAMFAGGENPVYYHATVDHYRKGAQICLGERTEAPRRFG